MKVTQVYYCPVFDKQRRVTGVRRDCAQSGEVHVVQHVYRVTDDNQVDEDVAEIKNMFHGMHPEPRPRVDVAVMECMPAPQLLGVQKTVHEVEVRVFEHDEQGKQQHEPHHSEHAGTQGEPGNEIVGVKPHEEHHIGCPDGDSADTREKHVVPHLRAAKELGIVSTVLTGVDSPPRPLVFERIEKEIQSTREQEGRDKIDRVDLRKSLEYQPKS
jgi:hypothetical protein